MILIMLNREIEIIYVLGRHTSPTTTVYNKKRSPQMDILTIEAIRQNINRANAQMYSVKENTKAAVLMGTLGIMLCILSSYVWVGSQGIFTETNMFIMFHLICGIAAVVFAVMMIINAVIDFRSACRKMRIVSSDMYKLEQSQYKKTA